MVANHNDAFRQDAVDVRGGRLHRGQTGLGNRKLLRRLVICIVAEYMFEGSVWRSYTLAIARTVHHRVCDGA